MQCPVCQHQNPDYARFCMKCGTVVAVAIPEPVQVTAPPPVDTPMPVAAPMPAPAIPYTRLTDAAPKRSAAFKQNGRTTVPMVKSIVVGLIVAAAILAVAFVAGTIPSMRYLRALFFERGFVQYTITLLGAWAIAILYLKRRQTIWQDNATKAVQLPSDIPTADVLAQALENVQRSLAQAKNSWLFRRLERTLAHFRATGDGAGMREMMQEQSDRDAQAVEMSYTLLRVLITVIPLLGFCGTVLGISDAVGFFSGVIQTAKELEEVTEKLGGVTTGLAVAFDTTLLSLLFTIPLMMVTSALKKREDELLAEIDEYCSLQLVERLQKVAPAAPALPNLLDDESLQKRTAILQESAKVLSHLSENFQGYRDALQRSFVEFQSVGAALQEVSGRQAAWMEQAKNVQTVAINLQTLAERLTQLPPVMSRALAEAQAAHHEQLVQQFQNLAGTIRESDSQIMNLLNQNFEQGTKAGASMVEKLEGFNNLLAQNLEQGTKAGASMTEKLESLGKKMEELQVSQESLSRPVATNLEALVERMTHLPPNLSRAIAELQTPHQTQLIENLKNLADTAHAGDHQIILMLGQYLDGESKTNGSVTKLLEDIRGGLERLQKPLENLSQPVTVTLSRSNAAA